MRAVGNQIRRHADLGRLQRLILRASSGEYGSDDGNDGGGNTCDAAHGCSWAQRGARMRRVPKLWLRRNETGFNGERGTNIQR